MAKEFLLKSEFCSFRVLMRREQLAARLPSKVFGPTIGHCNKIPQIARFMEPTWGPSGAGRTQVGPVLAPWAVLLGTWWCQDIETFCPLLTLSRELHRSPVVSLYMEPVMWSFGVLFDVSLDMMSNKQDFFTGNWTHHDIILMNDWDIRVHKRTERELHCFN